MLGTILSFALGLGALIAGAEILVRGASRLALSIGLSPLVVGLTIVAFGTSAPELSVSIQSALADQADIAVGNAVGSNIFNVLFILGASALIVPLVVHAQVIRQEVPVMIGVSLLLYALAYDNRLGRLDGALLFGLVIVYTVVLVRQSRREARAVQEEGAAEIPAPRSAWEESRAIQALMIAAGLGLLVLGSRWLVGAATAIAEALGVSQVVIALTIVAAGTSLPEVATSIVAAVRGERDIAVGNVVGSNIFNILSVLGLSSIVAPRGLPVAPSLLAFDMPVMIAVAIACLPVFATGRLIARWEGAVFLGYYVAYMCYLILAVRQHDALSAYSAVMLYFVAPLTALTLAILLYRELRARRAPA